jgi:hypothetical protein
VSLKKKRRKTEQAIWFNLCFLIHLFEPPLLQRPDATQMDADLVCLVSVDPD